MSLAISCRGATIGRSRILQSVMSTLVIVLPGFFLVTTQSSAQGEAPTVTICGNEELALSPLVTAGNGSADDPFIIDGLNAEESGAVYWTLIDAFVAFGIANTTSHVIVRIGELHSYSVFFSAHVVVWNCTNVVVEDSDFRSSYSDSFLIVANSSQITVRGNRLDGSRIVVDNSTDVVITRNSILWQNPGILVQSSSRVQIRDDYIRHCPVGVWLRNSTEVEVTGVTMVDNEVDFLDDNTEGANSYSEMKVTLKWTTNKTIMLSLVLIVESAMAVVAMRMGRATRKSETERVEMPEEKAESGGEG